MNTDLIGVHLCSSVVAVYADFTVSRTALLDSHF